MSSLRTKNKNSEEIFFLEQKKRNVILKPIILYNDQMLMKFKRKVLVRRGAGEGEDRLARKQSLPIITDKMIMHVLSPAGPILHDSDSQT